MKNPFKSLFGGELENAKFFIPLGAISGIAMELTSSLPERVNRDIFSSIIYDHLPWHTIAILCLTQIISTIIYPALPKGRVKKYIRELAFTFTSKLLQLSAPASFTIFGLAIACVLLGLVTLDKKYLSHATFFSLFSSIPILTHLFSRTCITAVMRHKGETFRGLRIPLALSIVSALLIVPFFNESPIEVSFKLPLGSYSIVKAAADKKGQNISDYSSDAAVSSALPSTSQDN